MSWEIELKARIKDWVQMKQTLDAKGIFKENYLKRDLYFNHPFIPGLESSGGLFRVRQQNDEYFVTQKEKKITKGLEESKEHEFQIDGNNFLIFLKNLGFQVSLEKIKEGLRYDLDGITAELSHVSGLGDFLELEILLEDEATDFFRQAAQEKLWSTVAALGLTEGDIEEKPYSQLYKELKNLK